VEHIRHTPGFSLKDLKYLIIDEADRLLEDAYQEWLQLVQRSTSSEARLAMPFGEPTEDINWRKHNQLMKIVLSASLTKRPAQLMHLQLNSPVLVRLTGDSEALREASSASAFPDTLTHHYLVIPAAKKPLALTYLLSRLLPGKKCLCFVNTSVNAIRVAKFTNSLKMDQGAEKCHFLTADTDKNVMDSILSDFSAHKFNILIASECLARGIDIPEIDAVINYDCPATASSYIHRAGRSARAGLAGSCYTILCPKEAIHFKRIIMPTAKRVRPDPQSLEDLASTVEEGVKMLSSNKSSNKSS
jgi:ATP-dependent RNA helicase DDX51/DBP6